MAGMRMVTFASRSFYTGDDIADALMEYARALAWQGFSDLVTVPARTLMGQTEPVSLLVSPTSEFISEPTDSLQSDIQDPAVVERLRALSAMLANSRSGGGSSGRACKD